MEFISIHGSNKQIPKYCRKTNWHYGSRQDGVIHAKPFMLDYNWKSHSIKQWSHYLNLLSKHKPDRAVIMDYERSSQLNQMMTRIRHVIKRHVCPIVVPKFNNACYDVPLWVAETFDDVGYKPIIGISVPSDYAGYLPTWQEVSGRQLHLLGGHPDQWAWLINYYKHSIVVSIDTNVFVQQARWGKLWSASRGDYIQLPAHKYSTDSIVMCSMRNASRYINSAVQPCVSKSRIQKCYKMLPDSPKQLPLI